MAVEAAAAISNALFGQNSRRKTLINLFSEKQNKLKFLFVNEMKMQKAPGLKVKLVKGKFKLGRSSRAKVYSFAKLARLSKVEKHLV